MLNTMIKKLLLLLPVLITGSLFAQGPPSKVSTPIGEAPKCSQHHRMQDMQAHDPERYATIVQTQLSHDLHYAPGTEKTTGLVYTIPVVFHVIHAGGTENISAAQIDDAIRILNRDYRKLNDDASTVQAAFTGMPSDVEIEFKLATVAPNGACFNGITRTNSSLTNDGSDGEAQIAAVIAGNDVYQGVWAHNKYLNIYVAADIGGAAGYTFLPNGNSTANATNMYYNGIFLLDGYCGAIGTGSENTSRALTHEVGHWLNLSHTWGDGNSPGDVGSCAIDDGVQDTPNCIGVTSCNLTSNTCNSDDAYWGTAMIDNVENYMDYSYCSKMFTQGQVDRMRTALLSAVGGRSNIWTTSNLQLVGAMGGTSLCALDFSANQTGICAGTSVTYTVNSTNNIATYSWSFPGGTPSTSTAASPVVTYNTAGVYNASLTVTATSNGASYSESKTSYMTVNSASTAALPVTQGFTTATFPPTNWSIVNSNSSSNTWKRTTTAGNTPTTGNSMMFDNYNFADTDEDEVKMQGVSLTGLSAAQLTFDVAYAPYNATYFDGLQVWVSSDCGATFTSVYSKSNTTLATAAATTGAFTPSAAQWRTETIDLSSFLGQTNVVVKFRNLPGNGNNLFVDNINLTGTAGTPPPVANFTGTPTTVCQGSTVTYTNTSTGSPTSYSWSFPGGTPSTSTATSPTVTYSTPGTYNVTLTATNTSGSDSEVKTSYITVLNGGSAALPVTQGFTTVTFPPANWTINNTDGSVTWERTTEAGFAPTAGNAMMFDNANIDDRGNTDEVQMQGVSLVGVSAAQLTFDVAYAPYDNTTYYDGLEVLVSTNCGVTFTSVYSKSNSTLATAPATNTIYTPTSAQWRTETISLSSYVGQASVIVKFRNLAGYGNRLFIDNINLSGSGGAAPVANFTGSPTTLCAGSTVTYTNSSTGTPTSYSWSFPGGTPSTSTSTNPTITYATAGTYSVTLTATNGSGSDAEVKTNYITVNAVPSTPGASSNSPLCAGSTITLTTATVAGATYAWSGPGGFTSTLQNPTRTASTTAMTGTYSVVVTVGGCSSAAGTTVVTVNAAPSTPIVTSNSPVCSGSALIFDGPVVAGATYSWSGPNGFTSTVQDPTVSSAVAGSAGTYSLTVTVGGCSSAAGTTVVAVNSVPSTPSVASNSPVCSGSAITLDGPTVAGATYSWTGPNGFTSTLENPSVPAASASDAGTYSLTVTVGGCTSAAGTTTVVVNAAPATPTPTSNSPVCSGQSILLDGPTVAGATYSWTGPNGFTSTLENPTVSAASVSDAGTYALTVTVGGCSSATAAVVVTVSPSGAPAFDPLTAVCIGSSAVTPPTTSTDGVSGTWSPSSFTTASAGTFTATFTPAGGSCATTTTISLTVNPTNVVPTFNALASACVGAAAVTPSTTSTNGVTGTWSPSSFSTASEGTFTATFTPGAGQCGTTTTISLTVGPPVTPTFTALTAVCQGATSPTLPGTSTNSVAGTWSPASISTATAGSFSSTFTPTAGACATTATISLTVDAPTTPTFTALGTACVGSAAPTLSTTSNNSITGTWSPTGFSTASTGTFTATFTPTAGQCAATTTLSLVVTTPTTPVFASVPAVCQNDAAVVLPVTSGNGISGTWTPATVNTASAGVVTATFFPSAGNCASTVTTSVTVTALPTVSFSGNILVGCIPLTVVFTGDSGMDASAWNFGDGGTASTVGTVTHVYTVAGVYDVTLQNTKLGCTKSVTNDNYITANDCSGLEEEVATSVQLFPNPSNGTVTITAEGSLIESVQVYDHAGRLVTESSDLQSASVQPNIAGLADGVYTVVVNTTTGVARLPLVIKL